MLPTTGIQTSDSPRFVQLRLIILYLGSLSAFFVRPTPALLTLSFLSLYLRTLGWEGGLHRYFAHRSFKTGRAFQLVLACLGAASGQRGPLWWASTHRAHHRHADTPRDPHTPLGNGKLYAYVGWLYDKKNCDTDLEEARDFIRYPELLWVNKYHYLFPVLWMVAMFVLGQWTPLFGGGAGVAALVWGFFVSTLLALQISLLTNAFAHAPRSGWFSYRNFPTADMSQNVWPLFPISLGLGQCWHNNHHRHMNSASTWVRWWEVDLIYLSLKLLGMLGVVWDIREVRGEKGSKTDIADDSL